MSCQNVFSVVIPIKAIIAGGDLDLVAKPKTSVVEKVAIPQLAARTHSSESNSWYSLAGLYAIT